MNIKQFLLYPYCTDIALYVKLFDTKLNFINDSCVALENINLYYSYLMHNHRFVRVWGHAPQEIPANSSQMLLTTAHAVLLSAISLRHSVNFQVFSNISIVTSEGING